MYISGCRNHSWLVQFHDHSHQINIILNVLLDDLVTRAVHSKYSFPAPGKDSLLTKWGGTFVARAPLSKGRWYVGIIKESTWTHSFQQSSFHASHLRTMVSLTSNVAVDYKRIHFLTPSQSSGDDIDNEEMLDALFPLEEQEVHMTLEEKAKLFDIHNQEARRLSIRLMNTTSEEEERRVLHKSLDLDTEPPNDDTRQPVSILLRVFALVFLLLLFLGCLVVLLVLGVMAVGPPKLPVGSYALVERQVSSYRRFGYSE